MVTGLPLKGRETGSSQGYFFIRYYCEEVVTSDVFGFAGTLGCFPVVEYPLRLANIPGAVCGG